MNVAIVGINQVYDKKLDRVNKPYLPLASGAFSSDTALSINRRLHNCEPGVGSLERQQCSDLSLVVSLLLGIVYSVDLPGPSLETITSPRGVVRAVCEGCDRSTGVLCSRTWTWLIRFPLPKEPGLPSVSWLCMVL